jgi:two-component system, OmpR family, sensor histidine kinase VicK
VAIVVAGLVGLGINASVKQVTDEALKYDIELEDRGDDLRVAVLDMRHYHRNVVFAGPSRRGTADLEAAYLQLLARIEHLEELAARDPSLPSFAHFRQLAEAYYAQFRPAIELYQTQPHDFTLASDDGLIQLAQLESAARIVDQLGEERAAAALRSVEAAADGAQAVLLMVLAGLVLLGVGLAYLIIRNLREQQRTAAELAHALQLKTDFIADASHELRTPLTVLRANAEVALELERNCIHTELLEEIVLESERMTRLVEDLLFLARSDSGSAPLELALVQIEPFLQELAERAAFLTRQTHTPLQTALNATGYLLIDPVRIEQVVLILIDNAAKYGPKGQPILLRSLTNGAELCIEVIDQGPGISAQELSLIFERFYRVDKARSRRQGGAGLGLAIAKSIIAVHNGRIEADSVLNQGTTMRIYLPLASPPAVATAPAGPMLLGETT